MSRMKSIFAVLALTAIVGVVPQAGAQTVTLKLVISGSSALWQTMALGAYNSGTSIVSGGGTTCHWTSASNVVNLTDARTTVPNNDAGTLWVVWDNDCGNGANATTNVWAFNKVDSVVGDRCYFAAPKCTMSGTTAVINTSGSNQITLPGTIWGGSAADVAMPAAVQAVFTSGATSVNAAATDIRPEDAAFAACRVNSALGFSSVGGSKPPSDALDGLGYNSNNAPGVCPVYSAATAQAAGLGTPIKSGYPGSTGQANVLAFNLTGHDPITDTALPASYTTTTVGAAPIVFIIERDKGQLSKLTSASEVQLQQAFSGTSCNASAFGLTAGPINIFLREPLSGTMNTTEATVFRRPTVYPTAVLGLSQEKNVNGPVNNPLAGNSGTCVAGGGARYRAIGTGEEVKSVLNSGSVFTAKQDGIGYTFFSYGNVSSIANNSAYGYIQLNGVDPIFASYGTTIDPGQPATAGTLPAAANLPATCAGGLGAFPCNEVNIWKNGFSFPNLRNGTYRAWSLLRIVATGTASTNAAALVKASNAYVVTSVPDYVSSAVVTGTLDLGLKLLRSHYQQKDGGGALLGPAPVNSGADKGGDMGGQIIPTLIGVTTYKETQLIQNGTLTSQGPVIRP
jgi:hypothetical protein